MRLEQLRFLCAIVDNGHNISRAAQALGVRQPGITQQIKLLERELRTEILLRRDGRIVGLTDAGRAILAIARRMLDDADNVRRVSDEFTQEASGRLAIATTHVHARYYLLPVIERFRRRYPKVQLILQQATPARVLQLVASREADIGIASRPAEGSSGMVLLPSYTLTRVVVTPPRHPLLACRRLALEDIARFPLITYDAGFAGASAVTRAFVNRGLDFNVVMTASDGDVIKAYVELGLGVAVLPSVAFDAKRDTRLRGIGASHLFEHTQAMIELHPHAYLRRYMFDFIQLVDRKWTEAAIVARLEARG